MGCIHSVFFFQSDIDFDFKGTSREPTPPPGLLVLGGQSVDGHLTSIEMFGFENCTIPPLPETRYFFGSFITPTKPRQLAVCGGWWMGKPNSTDCLTLNVTSGQWERGRFTNGPLRDGVRGVINMEGEGVYIVHRTDISFLAEGSNTWTPGTTMAWPAECGCYLTKDAFVTIHSNETYNVQEYATKEKHWRQRERWPSMRTPRTSPACGATTYLLIVAGGVSGLYEVLASVEVYNIETRARRMGGNLREPRALFSLVPVGASLPRLLAIGGHNGTSVLATSEWYDQENNEWSEGPTMVTGRKNFGAAIVPVNLACTHVDPPPHSCPALDVSQDCIFHKTTGFTFRINFFFLILQTTNSKENFSSNNVIQLILLFKNKWHFIYLHSLLRR